MGSDRKRDMKYCIKCKQILAESDSGYLYCVNEDCSRYGLLSIFATRNPGDMKYCRHEKLVRKQINPNNQPREWYECESCGSKFLVDLQRISSAL